jgi:hypothetical protein
MELFEDALGFEGDTVILTETHVALLRLLLKDSDFDESFHEST